MHQAVVTEIRLNPMGAVIGTPICVVGNDGGEKQMILPGILGKLDREAPYYDLNTFYLAAANGTSGGSSGSPVLALDGTAIALNSGGKLLESASFFYPLDSVVRALEYIRNSLTVPRGDLFAVFQHRSFDEATRLGVHESIISEVKTAVEQYSGLQ